MADSLASSASSADLARKRSRSSSPSADPAAKKANQAAAAPDKLEVDEEQPAPANGDGTAAAADESAAAMQTDDQAKLEESADAVKGEGEAAKDESAPMNVDSTGAPSAAQTSSTNPDLPANPGLPANPEADASASASADGAASGASAIQMRALIVTQDASIIIGKQGKNVNEIRDKSGAKITITEAVPGNPERIMVIGGQLDAVSKAFGLIVRRINDEPFDVPSVPGSRAVTIRFIIPNSRMGSVIGKAGAKIKEIQEASGARLQASEALLPGSTERVLSVSGVADAIHIAVYYIGTVLQEHPVATNNASYRPGGGDYAPPRERSYGGGSGGAPSGGGYGGAPPPPRREGGGGMGMGPAVGPGAQTQQIFIPNELVGSIIGKAGAKINEVRQVSQCQIKINEPGEAAPGGSPLERLVTITGQPSGIQVATRDAGMSSTPTPRKRPFAHLDPKLSLERTDSLASLNAETGALELAEDGSLPDGTETQPTSGAPTPGQMEGVAEEREGSGAKRAKLEGQGSEEKMVVGEGKVHVSSSVKGKGKGKVKEESEKVLQGKKSSWWTEGEMSKRRDQFLRAHADVFTPLLPNDKGALSKLLSASSSKAPVQDAIPYRRLEQPKLIAGEGIMKDYQLAGLSFLAYQAENGMNCILADEMGLGKTLQTLSLIAYLAETYGSKGPHLLICPLSVLGSWMSEIARWLPSFTAMRFHGPANERQRLKEECASNMPDLVCTTYEAFTSEQGWFKKNKKWGLCVLDEGHKIKNHESNAAMALHGINARMRIILSGTPLQNNLAELWSLLYFLYPAIFHLNSLAPFKRAFDLGAGSYDQSFLLKSQNLLSLIMLRRTKEGVRGQLTVPPREEMTLYVPLSPAQKFWYRAILSRTDTVTLGEIFTDFEVKYTSKKGRATAVRHARERKEREEEAIRKKLEEVNGGGAEGGAEAGPAPKAEEEEEAMRKKEQSEDQEDDAEVRENIKRAIEESKNSEAGGNAWMKMMNLLMQLRKTCSHPYLLPNAEAEPFEVAEHIVAASSKLIALDKLLKDILPKGERVLIFSGFTRMLDILEDHMHLRGYKYARLDGSTSRPRRALDIKLFQQEKSPYQCFLISTRAGGLGINLTAATTVVMYDQDWNPQTDIQAISRAHRIGQTKEVKVYRLVCQDSVEEQMLTRLRKKLYLSAKVMGQMKNLNERPADELVDPSNETAQTEDEAPKMTRGELAGILRGGAGALAKWTSIDGTGDDVFEAFRAATFSELCARGKQRDETKEAGIKIELGMGEAVSEEERRRLEEEEEEAERLLLQGREVVQSRKFEGTLYKASNAEIRREWQESQAKQNRALSSRTVMVDGHAVLKETVANGNWEAVKTITSDPTAVEKLANTKRQKKRFDHQDFCFACKDGGEVYTCGSCPRVMHQECSGLSAKELKEVMTYYCPQHSCSSCGRNTQQAGGLLCQVCPNAHCEDCLGEGELEAVGDVLPEFLLLDYGKRAQAFYIRCAECTEHFQENPDVYKEWRAEQDEIEAEARREGYVF
ncbi:hypothetical protein JCM21900_003969 [Sporobolomyces salmonicolor]